MESKKFLDGKNTIGNCIRRCKKMGKKYAGVEVRCFSTETYNITGFVDEYNIFQFLRLMI